MRQTLPFDRGVGAQVTRLRRQIGAAAFFNGVGTGQLVQAAVAATALGFGSGMNNAAFSGSFVIDGTTNPFNTWLTPSSTAVNVRVFHALELVLLFISVDVTIGSGSNGQQPGDTIQHRVIDDGSVVRVGPSQVLISAQTSLNSVSTVQGIGTVGLPALGAGTYPATRTYTVQVFANQGGRPSGGTLSVNFTAIRIWALSIRR